MRHLLFYTLWLCSLFFTGLNAQQESRNSRGYANHLLIPGSYIQTYDDKYTAGSWISGFDNYRTRAVIELGLDEDRHLAHPAAIRVCAKFDLELTDAAHQVTQLYDQELDITYDPAELSRYKDKAQLSFEDVYHAKVYNVRITYCASSVSCGSCHTVYTQSDVYLQAEISTQRIYSFGFAATFTTGDLSHTVTPQDQAVIAWPYQIGATEYELEYTFVDNYTSTLSVQAPSTSLIYDLDHDATRIVTGSNSYSIPLTYEQGYLVYRVRPVGTNTLFQRIEGAWFPAAGSGSLSSSPCVIPIQPDFPSRHLAWQSQKTFAERGKTGIGVRFFDAAGQPRQQLARLNHESKTLAQSTLFDFYNRPAIELLPSPIPQLDFNYRFGLNIISQGTLNSVFDRFVFEDKTVNDFCAPSSFSLNPTLSSGAANYYSPHNSQQEGYQGYLPDAENLPYAQLQYTEDGLSQVARQTLPGALHRLGGGRETHYRYSNPGQVELDRIFGSEAGRQEYYYRTTTIDPNGQISLNYQDLLGRTVASCLKGLNPTNLEPLANLTNTLALQEDYHLQPTNRIDFDKRCLEVDTEIEIFQTGTEEYFYQVDWGLPFTDCDLKCYSCVYEVTLSLKDECGVEIFDHDGDGGASTPAGYRGLVGPSPPYTTTISCGLPTTATLTGASLSAPVTLTFSHPGKYKLHKKICVSELPTKDYARRYETTASCLKSKCDFFESLLNATDFSGCGLPTSCSSCTSAVISMSNTLSDGELHSFPHSGYSNSGVEPSSPTGSNIAVYTESMTPQEVSEALEKCDIYCQADDPCSVYNKLMESDFYPNGAFAATDPLSPNWPYSIFNPANLLDSPSPLWSDNSRDYRNAIQQPDYVQINGQNKYPYELSKDEFVLYFRKSWAKELVKLHPELCKKHFYCELLGKSLEYDKQMNSFLHYDQACGSGFLYPVRYSPYSAYSPTACSTSSAGIDPIVQLATAYPAFATAINTFTTDIRSNFRKSGMDLYQYIAIQSNTVNADGTSTISIGQNPCDAEDEWAMFKHHYLAHKQRLYATLYNIYITSIAPSATCTSLPPGIKSWFPDHSQSLDASFPVTGTNTPASTLYGIVADIPDGLYSDPGVINTYTNALQELSDLMSTTLSAAMPDCDTTCHAYKKIWDARLRLACPAYQATTSPIQDLILEAMTKVCVLGCDLNSSMLGASTTSPGLFYTLPSSGGYTVNSFQQILDYYLGTEACDAIITDTPRPYPSHDGTPLSHTLSSCQCDIVLQTAHSYSNQTTYEWEYFQQLHGYDLADYYKLKCVCQAASNYTWSPGHTWTPAQLSNLASYSFQSVPDLSCNRCLNCQDVALAIESLSLSLPVSSTLSTLEEQIASEPGNRLYVLNHLNQRFGDHSLETYLDLYEDCKSFTLNASYTYAQNVTQQAEDLYIYLNALVQDHLINPLFPRAMNLCTDDKFFLSSLYDGPLPGILSHTYTAVVNSNSLHLHITGPASQTVASILLVKPPAHTGSWEDLTTLYNFMAYAPPPHATGAIYEFEALAADVNFITFVIRGAVTNGAYPIGYLSPGSSSTLNLPSLCPAPEVPEKNTCTLNLINHVINQAKQEHKEYLAAASATFLAAYRDYCFGTLNEVFTRTYRGGDEYNYTLYYYDQAGNLQRTVPPLGADPGILTTVTTAIQPSTTLLPAYSGSAAVHLHYASDYRYNSYNQIVREENVDGGLSEYHYDAAGRLIASQNARQRAASTGSSQLFSYSLYDPMGRLTESGEASLSASQASFVTQPHYGVFESMMAGVSTRSQVTRVYYDRPAASSSVQVFFSGQGQEHLRNRVSFVIYMDLYDPGASQYDYATYYSYDDHGNLTELVQHHKKLDHFGQGFRNVKYQFELISGNMLRATYQENQADQLIHHYHYDEDNRLKEVFTSKDGLNWDRDAKYFYYEHGPLARVERGDKKVQGTDYFYTIHGWIKGVNSDALLSKSDPGKDAGSGNSYLSSYQDLHKWVGADAMSFGLNYYHTAATDDYKPIKTFSTGNAPPLMSVTGFSTNTAPFYLDDNSAILSGDGADLFNGNISSMSTSFIDKDPSNSIPDNQAFPLLTAYRYDQLHRLTRMKSYRGFLPLSPAWNPSVSTQYDDAYKMDLSYDPNGNILSLMRNGPGNSLLSGSGFPMDNLQYGYYNSGVYSQSLSTISYLPYNSNRLRCLSDQVAAGNYGSDIDDIACTDYEYIVSAAGPGGLQMITPGSKRYDYDATGNLIADKGEYIALIEWTLDRKVKRILRDSTRMSGDGITRPDIEYAYNAQRQRVMKLVKPREISTGTLSPAQDWTYTYYVYDASGNLMATYDRVATQLSGSFHRDRLGLLEQPIYGSERLALARPEHSLAAWSYTFDANCISGNGPCRDLVIPGTPPASSPPTTGTLTERHLGFKDFELNNHLGNVITTVSDRKLPGSYIINNCVKEFDFTLGVPPQPEINANNMSLSISASGSLICTMTTNGFISGINPRFGNNLSNTTVYQIDFDFDPGTMTPSDGLYLIPFDLDENFNIIHNGSLFWNYGSVPPAGHYSFTYTPTYTGAHYASYVAFNSGSGANHFQIANLRMCPMQGAVDSYSADITSHTDYYPGGQSMPGRTWQGGDKYRYSHNGHEREDEVFTGAQSAEFWMYDSRILRRWEIDPIIKPWESPYACFSNDPIYHSDPNGLDSKDPKEAESGAKDGAGTKYSNGDNMRTNGNTTQIFNTECNCYISEGLEREVSIDNSTTDNSVPAVATGGSGGVPTGQESITKGDPNYVDPVEATDNWFARRQNLPDLRPSVKASWMKGGVMPFGSSPNKNTGFQTNGKHVQVIDNDGFNSWLPGAALGGRSYNPAAKDGASLGTILGPYFNQVSGVARVKTTNALVSSGSTLGENTNSLLNTTNSKPSISTSSYDTIYMKWNDPNGNISYRFVIKNENGDSIDGKFYTGPGPKK